MIADFLPGGGRHLVQVEAAKDTLRVTPKVGSQEGAERGARRGNSGGDIQCGGFAVLVLQDLAGVGSELRNLGHGGAVEEPTAIGLAAQADAIAVRAGERVDIATDGFGNAFGVHFGGAENGFQVEGEQSGIAFRIGQAAQVQTRHGGVDIARVVPAPLTAA